MPGEKYRMRCIGEQMWAGGKQVGQRPACGWKGVRTDHIECECYDIWRLYCRPLTPGPGCPRGINWSCPRCKGAVTGRPAQPRIRVGGQGGTPNA